MNTYRTKKDIIKDARAELKKALPQWTFSLTQPHHASFHLNLMSGPEQVVEAYHQHVHNFPRPGATPEEYQFKVAYSEEKPFSGYAQINHYQLLENRTDERGLRLTNGEYLSPLGWEVMRKAVEIVNRENWDESDSMTDYFHCNYYLHVSIGKWDKPYQVKAG